MAKRKEPQTIEVTKLIRKIAEIILNSGPIKQGDVIKVTMDGDPNAAASNVAIMDKALEEVKVTEENLSNEELASWKLNALFGAIGQGFNNAVELRMHLPERFNPPRFRLPFLIIKPRKINTLVKQLDNALYLDSAGNLWQKPKERFCYAMERSKNRYKILRYLSENRGYQSTQNLALALETRDKQYIRGEVPKINKQASVHLGITSGKLIEGKKGSGYRINPNYRIELVHA